MIRLRSSVVQLWSWTVGTGCVERVVCCCVGHVYVFSKGYLLHLLPAHLCAVQDTESTSARGMIAAGAVRCGVCACGVLPYKAPQPRACAL